MVQKPWLGNELCELRNWTQNGWDRVGQEASALGKGGLVGKGGCGAVEVQLVEGLDTWEIPKR